MASPAALGARRSSEKSDARERVLATAYDLFTRHGIRAVGVDTIIAHSGVAKMSVYRHFKSKDELVVAVLERRETRWTRGWLEAEVTKRGGTAAERLLGIFDLFDTWFRRRDFEGCFFVNALLEFEDRKHMIHQASKVHLANIRAFLRSLAAEAGVSDPDEFAHQWHILMKGSIVAAGEGDRAAARRAQAVGALLLDQSRPKARSKARS
jgi:AcrR family transcriptional regulator